MSLEDPLTQVFLLVSALLLPAIAYAGEDQARTLVHQGIARQYDLHLPSSLAPHPRPLVVALHGLGQPVESLHAWLPLIPVADREGFAVAYPKALDGRWGYWPGARVFVPGQDANEVDDTGFIAAMVQSLVAEGIADPARTYVTGVSRGALMAYTLMCARPDLFAAAAPLSSGMTEAQVAACHPDRQIPMLAVAGTADPIQFYDGWLPSPPVPRLLSVPETMEFWRRQHGCEGQTIHQLPHRDRDDPTRTRRVEWTGCKAGGPVVLYKVIGGGHQPPSYSPNSEDTRRSFGRRGEDIETAEEVWTLFSAASPVSAP